MKFVPTTLAGAFVVVVERHEDPRGFFGRTFCTREFEEQGIPMSISQCNVSFNAHRGTVRGMHYQTAPHAEAKVIRCTRGRVFDVLVDLRPDSPTYRQWYGRELSSTNHEALYAPEGLAHGFQTLEPDSELFYLMSAAYAPEHAAGVAFDDPAFGIAWPEEITVFSDRDREFPRFEP